MEIFKNISKWYKKFKECYENDPLKKCTYYKRHGCAHVDGYLCDVKTCNTLQEFKEYESLAKLIDSDL